MDAMHTQQTIDTLCELYDLGAWMDAMPNVPGHHRNADGLMETYQNIVDAVLAANLDIGAAFSYASGAAFSYASEADMWQNVADAMEIELTR